MPQSVAPVPKDTSAYEKAQLRLDDFLDQGFVVSKDANGVSQNKGDGLIFTGLAMYGLDCARGAKEADALEHMLKSGIYRFPGNVSTVSLDGVLGLYRGIAKRVTVCGEKDRWHAVMTSHKDLMPAGFDVVDAQLLHALDLGGEPSADRISVLAYVVADWAKAVEETKSACYRIHLGLLALQTLQELGRNIPQFSKDNFCSVTKNANIPTVNGFCKNAGLEDFISSFTYNVWQYRHQRCSAWESPDGQGLSQPAVDLLVAWSDLYGSQH